MRPNQDNRRRQPPPPSARSSHPSDSTMRPNQTPRQPPPYSPSPSPSPRPLNSNPRSNDQPPAPPQRPPVPVQVPEPEPTFAAYPPYIMPPPQRHRSGGSSCASCMLATAFLLTIAVIAVGACFVLFKPQDPKIAVDSVRFPAFSLTNGTIDFTIFQYVAVQNPNRYSFTHYDSSLQLFYYGNQLGFMFIPAGQIAPGRTQYVSATFNVKSIPVADQPSATVAVSGGGAMLNPGPTMEVETRMKMVGRVKVLKLLAHHVETRVRCRVTILVSNGNVLGFHC